MTLTFPPGSLDQPADASTPGHNRRAELADFLRSRRLRLQPEQVGLGSGGRRRTAGLRREEVAMLAEISTTWYTWLEQRRDIRVSGPLLDRLAAALRLDSSERLHLFALASQPLPISAEHHEVVPPAVLRFVRGLTAQPAYVLGRRWDYLAWNDAAEAVFGEIGGRPPEERNVLRRMFLDPARRRCYADWACAAAGILARFRADSAHSVGEPWLAALTDELSTRSPDFRRMWARHDVRANPDGLKDFRHPLLGRLALEHLTLPLPGAPDLRLVVYTPLPDHDTPAKLARLLANPAWRSGLPPE